MFIKHLKHDLRFGRTMNLVLCISVIAAAVAARIMYAFAAFPANMSDTIDFTAMLVVGLIIGFVAVHISQFIEKSMFGDSGYLTFTLPISRERLLVSKIITAWLWFNLLLLTVFISITILQGTKIDVGETVMNRDGTVIVVYNTINNIPKISPAFIAYYINLTFVFFFAVNVMILGFTLHNSVFGKWKVHGAIASSVGLGAIFSYSFALVQLLDRNIDVRLTPNFGSEQYLVMGLDVGRLEMFGSYFDIYIAAISFAFGLLAFFATLYLLKRHVSLQ